MPGGLEADGHASWLLVVCLLAGLALGVAAAVLASRQRRLARRLASSAGLLDTIDTGADDGILVVDIMGVVRFANPPVAMLTGRPTAQIVGSRLAGLVHPADVARLIGAGPLSGIGSLSGAGPLSGDGTLSGAGPATGSDALESVEWATPTGHGGHVAVGVGSPIGATGDDTASGDLGPPRGPLPGTSNTSGDSSVSQSLSALDDSSVSQSSSALDDPSVSQGSLGRGSARVSAHSPASGGVGAPTPRLPHVAGERGRPEIRLLVAGGTWRHVEVSVGPASVRLPTGATEAGCRTLVVRDVTERVVRQRHLEEQARLDQLTGLPNRGWFSHQLAERLDERDHHRSAVLFVDLDGFKRVNDTAGHAAGDRLLANAARRLAHTLRGDDLVGRLSGDEFAALVTAESEADVLAVSHRVREQLAAPYSFAAGRMTVSASVGVAFVEPDSSAESLLVAADLAMYEAKRQGGARFAVFRPDMLRAATDGAERRERLRAAVERDEVAVRYRPRVDLETGEVVAAVAALHWPDAAAGLGGQELDLDTAERVLRRAVDDAGRWNRSGRQLPVAVDVVGGQVGDLGLPARIGRLLDGAALRPERLLLQVPERLAAHGPDDAVETLAAVRALGVRVALSGVGGGCGCLGPLPTLPIDEVTVASGRVRAATVSSREEALLRTVVTLGRELGLGVVAEGVDGARQALLTGRLGIPVVQGAMAGRPVPANEVPRRVVPQAPSGATAGVPAMPRTSPPAPTTSEALRVTPVRDDGHIISLVETAGVAD